MSGSERQARFVLIALAALQGAVLWWLYRAMKSGGWPATDPAWLAALLAPAILVPPLVYLQLGLGRLTRIAATAGAAALALFGIGWHFGARVIGAPLIDAAQGAHWMDDAAPYALALPLLVLCFHALPFMQSALANGRVRAPYPQLFVFAWRNALLVALAALFTGVLWLLLLLWAQLFDMIGIRFFRDIFRDSRFAIPATAIAFAAGIGLAGSVERLQTALRQQLLGLFKWLAVLAFVILTLFSLALLAKSPELFASGRRAIGAGWLLWLLVLCVYLLNAAYQDGSIERPYPRALATFMRWAAPLLVVVALLALYALGVRIRGYGLTIERAWALLVALLALIYAAGYAIAALRRGPWMALMGRVNVVAALALIGALLLMLTPLLSPYRLTAASQAARALVAQPAEPSMGSRAGYGPDQDALWVLRFGAGAYGREHLARLAALQDHPRAAAIRARAAQLLSTTTRYGATAPPPAAELELVVFPDGRAIDAALREALATRAELGDIARGCARGDGGCPVLLVDLDGDGVDEAVAFGEYTVAIMAIADGAWQPVGFARPAVGGDGLTRARAFELLRAGEYHVVPPRYQALQLGDFHFGVVDSGPARALTFSR